MGSKRMNYPTLISLSAVCLSVSLPLNGLSPSLSLVAAELGFDDHERDLYLGGYVSIATMVRTQSFLVFR
jgi:hypothetical protein